METPFETIKNILKSDPELSAWEKFYKTAVYYKVPEHAIGPLFLYVGKRIKPGSFLMAVLSNDLMEAFGRADRINQTALFDICSFIYNKLPLACYGSVKIVNEWIGKTWE